jgi:hypothetical protein
MDFISSKEMTIEIKPITVKPDEVVISQARDQPSQPMSNQLIDVTSRTESDIYKKYSAMTFKEVKEECARLHISCSGLRQDYVRKLVAYELDRLVVFVTVNNA